jgi:predicted RNA polymerase sigma factor
LADLGRNTEAAAAFDRALSFTSDAKNRAYLNQRAPALH